MIRHVAGNLEELKDLRAVDTRLKADLGALLFP